MKKILLTTLFVLGLCAHDMDDVSKPVVGRMVTTNPMPTVPKTWTDLLVLFQTSTYYTSYEQNTACIEARYTQLPVFLDILKTMEENASTKADALTQQMNFIGQTSGEQWTIWSCLWTDGRTDIDYRIYPMVRAFLLYRSTLASETSWWECCTWKR